MLFFLFGFFGNGSLQEKLFWVKFRTVNILLSAGCELK